MLFTWRSFPPTSDNPVSLPSRHPTRPICAHPPHILSSASHTITHLTSLSPLPPPKSPPSSHFTGTQQDVTQILFRGRKRVRVASYVSIGRSPLHFQHPPPHYTSITLLELAIYFCPLRERTHYPLRPLRGRGVMMKLSPQPCVNWTDLWLTLASDLCHHCEGNAIVMLSDGSLITPGAETHQMPQTLGIFVNNFTVY